MADGPFMIHRPHGYSTARQLFNRGWTADGAMEDTKQLNRRLCALLASLKQSALPEVTPVAADAACAGYQHVRVTARTDGDTGYHRGPPTPRVQ